MAAANSGSVGRGKLIDKGCKKPGKKPPKK